jgi:hypothetical protein
MGLEPPSSCIWRIGKLVIHMNLLFIYIRNRYLVFSHFSFHVKTGVLCY